MKTPTPRTDAATYPADCLGKTLVTNRDCPRELERELTTLTAERDQLRAENTTLRAAQKACEACDEPTAFEVRQLRAELAAERARLDAGQILLTVAGERVWHCGVDLRAAIDAAMKEGAK
jgi:hypothetical protein